MSLVSTAIPFRNLPVPARSYFDREFVKYIKSIPDEDTIFTDEQVAWMHRVLVNLEYYINEATGLDDEVLLELLLGRKAEFEAALEQQRQNLLKISQKEREG